MINEKIYYEKINWAEEALRTRGFSASEMGAYWSLRMDCNRAMQAGIPTATDDKTLAGVANLRGERWQQVKNKVMKFFDVSSGFLVFQPSLKNFEAAKAAYERRAQAARTGCPHGTPVGDARENSQVIEKQGNNFSNAHAKPIQQELEQEQDSNIKNIAKEEKYIKRRNSNSEIIDRALKIYNSIAVQYSGVICKVLNPIKQSKLLRRVEDAKGIDMFETILNEAVQHSQFLQGKVPPSEGHKQFRLSIDFICQENSFNKIMNGNYNDQEPAGISHLPSQNRNYSNNKSGSFVEAIFNRLAS